MGASRSTKPFSAHPAFPVIVALWFAALLGLGTFVVPPANFAGLVVGTGLDELIPAAAPPLGDTARLAISAIAALLGALLGLAIAARIRRVKHQAEHGAPTAEADSDSPWLADGDQPLDDDRSGMTSPFDEPADDEAAGTVPGRLARRHSVSEHDDMPLGAEPEDEVERIFQASEINPGDAADADPDAIHETGVLAEEGYSDDLYPGDGCSGDGDLLEDDEDLQRFAADRLVAGLPRVQRRNLDDDPLEDWSRPEPVVDQSDLEAGVAAMPEPGDTEPDDPDFDAATPSEEAEYEELPVEAEAPEPRFDAEPVSAETGAAVEWEPAPSEAPVETSWAADEATENPPEPDPSDFVGASLADLVARFDTALAARQSRLPAPQVDPAETQPGSAPAGQSDDPVIAFLRREADRDRGTQGDSQREHADDPRAVLRSALDKLDRVSRKS